ncbi:MAG: hypothetical protein ACI8S6_003937 [Myxococcota bacterium]|jgi:hypothetical protein
MPLAGRMKLNTFLALIGSSIAVCGSATFIGSSIFWPDTPEPDPEPIVAIASPVEASSSTPAVAVAVAVAVAAAPETAEAIVLSWQGRALGSEKRKDIESGKPFKINLYQDSGHTTVNRAKVDLDRDDRWDEKWTFDGTTITRQVSPSDDENYSEELTWSGSAWTAPGAEPAPAPTTAAATEAPSIGRPVDQYLVAQRGRDLGTSKIKDATKGQSYKVNLYQDAGNGVINRAKIDLDRDDRWDEKWTFDGVTITRKVSPGDNEDYSVSQVWGPEGWQ